MSVISRCFGGLRTNDRHELAMASVRNWRRRVRARVGASGEDPRPQLLEVPGAILRDWWERQGRPAEGPVFPALRGKHAGEAKVKVTSRSARPRYRGFESCPARSRARPSRQMAPERLSGRDRTRTCDIRLVRPGGSSSHIALGGDPAWSCGHEDQEGPGVAAQRQNPTAIFGRALPLLDAAFADACLAFVLRGLASRAGLRIAARSPPARRSPGGQAS